MDTSGGELSVLVVEDDHLDAEGIIEALRAALPGVRTMRIASEWEFQSRFQEIVDFSPDLVTLDIMLPWCHPNEVEDAPPPRGEVRQAGIRLWETIRDDPGTQETQVMVCSHVDHQTVKAYLDPVPARVHFPQEKSPKAIAGLARSIFASLGQLPDAPALAPAPRPRNKIFISYSHKDRKWLAQTKTALRGYIDDDRILLWDDTQLEPGKWRDQLEEQMRTAGVALFLVSMNFCASRFIRDKELPRFLAAHEEESVKIAWVLVTACAWKKTPLEPFQCLNDPKRPLEALSSADRNKKLNSIARKIARLFE